jgi:hypothetical protein
MPEGTRARNFTVNHIRSKGPSAKRLFDHDPVARLTPKFEVWWKANEHLVFRSVVRVSLRPRLNQCFYLFVCVCVCVCAMIAGGRAKTCR